MTKLDVKAELDPALRRKLTELQEEGFEIWQRFAIQPHTARWTVCGAPAVGRGMTGSRCIRR